MSDTGKRTHYVVATHCTNCGAVEKIRVPIGQERPHKVTCENCECFTSETFVHKYEGEK